MTGPAYGAAIRAFVECCNKENGGNLIDNLKGIIVDWSSAQINSIKFAFGEERGEELLRGIIILAIGILILLQLRDIIILGSFHESTSACS